VVVVIAATVEVGLVNLLSQLTLFE
jgi:hypothetical protein